MSFDLLDMQSGQRVGTLEFTAAGSPVPRLADGRGPEVLDYLLDLRTVWLPSRKARVPADLANGDCQQAAAAALGVLGIRAVKPT